MLVCLIIAVSLVLVVAAGASSQHTCMYVHVRYIHRSSACIFVHTVCMYVRMYEYIHIFVSFSTEEYNCQQILSASGAAIVCKHMDQDLTATDHQ